MTTNYRGDVAVPPPAGQSPSGPTPSRGSLRSHFAVALLLMPLMGCAGHETTRHGDRVDVSKYPEEIRDAYRVFAFRCSRCHTLARPLNARIDDPQHWVRYVRRMRRQPSSGIDDRNGETILKFLLYYHRARLNQDAGAPEQQP